MFLLAVHVDAEGQIFRRLKLIDLFLQQQGVGAEVDVFLAGDESFDDFLDLRVQQRLAAGDADHRGAAFIDGFEALFRGQLFFENVAGY